MKNRLMHIGKKGAALVLALIMLVSGFAAYGSDFEQELSSMEGSSRLSDGENSLSSQIPESAPSDGESSEESSEAPESSEESGVGESSEISDDEASASGLEEETTKETVYAANPLLVTGGHETYMSGYSGGYFKPEAAMTRAEVATMLYNLLATKPAVSASKFTDVKLTSWYGRQVNALAEAGVLNGYKDGTFMPNRTITRAEFVTAVSKCFSVNSGTASFSDVSESHWAYKYIASAVNQGWINGYGNGTFRPDSGIKRCEAVKIMNAALDRKDSGFAADRNVQKFKDVSKSHWAFLEIAEAAKPTDSSGSTDDPDDPDANSSLKAGDTVRVNASSGLNMRASASTAANVVTLLSNGTALTVIEIATSPWIKVKTSSGTAGYVHSGYVEKYVPGQASGATLSSSSVSMHQYQTVRLDGSVTAGLDSMTWSSSDSSVAVVGYTVNYSGSKMGGMIYGKKPGTATITFADASGNTKATCKVTVQAAEAVRFAYSSMNVVPLGSSFDLIGITDTSRSEVNFQIVNGPATGAYKTTKYTEATQNSKHGLPTNTVRVFTRNVTFSAAGTYTVRATSKNSGGYSSDYYEFTVMVSASSSTSVTETSYNSRRASTEIIKVLANFESLISEVEDDSLASMNPTVGYGYVVPVNSAFYNTLTKEEGMAFLTNTVNKAGYSSAVERFRSSNNLKMSQAQFDALVSFVYNLGSGKLSTEYGTFRAMMNSVVPPSDASASKPYTGTLNVSTGSIFKDTDIDSSVVATVDQGKTVSVIGSKVYSDKNRKEVWYQVKYDGKTGWMPAGYVKLNASGLVYDLAYADSTVLANNLLQWNKASGIVYAGLVYRRMAEAKIFFFGNYAEAYHSNANYTKNTYKFDFPQGCDAFDNR